MGKEELEIAKVINDRCQAMVKQEIDKLQGLMADDIVLTHINGLKQTKNEWLEEIATGRIRYFTIKVVDLEVTILGNKASATFLSIIDAEIYAHRNVWRLTSESFFEKRNQQWLWVTSPAPAIDR